MNNDVNLYKLLKENLSICRLTTRHDEIMIRCPYCGDSIKDSRHTHFYIMNRPPYKFYCQRCNTSGYFSSKTLRDLNIFDTSMNDHLSNSLKLFKRTLNIKYGSGFQNYFNKKIDFNCKIGDIERKKIEYIEKRLGIKLNIPEDLFRYKIVLNFHDFFERNKINKEKVLFNDRMKEQFKKIDLYAVGFLSFDKNTIICRSLDEEKTGFRYHNFTIYNDALEISRKFYNISNEIDLSNSVFNIILSEGVFDIIAIHNHFFNKEMDNCNLFISANGKGYDFILNFIRTLGVLNCDIYIYSDSDVELKKYKQLMKRNTLAKFNGVNIYYNKIGKDCGVPKDKIELSSPVVL